MDPLKPSQDTPAAARPGPARRLASSSRPMDDINPEVLVNYLYQQQDSKFWIGSGGGEKEGVLLRKKGGQYLVCPSQLTGSPFAKAAAALKVECVMTVNSRIIRTFLQWFTGPEVPLDNGCRAQVLPTIEDIAHAKRQNFAAFVASEGLLVVWDKDALHIVSRASNIESQLRDLIWKSDGNEDEADE
ncbi:unnamed protein product [Clonostachys chloroleuca]|uniref:DUF7928 domain-containing protein n=1 Tax=Clonostachys chloroleuca TaxID=1926264 RepID=A0AA35PVN8_9HYPO|nr:unnamed protein product [Clonostachys chloroleuca]